MKTGKVHLLLKTLASTDEIPESDNLQIPNVPQIEPPAPDPAPVLTANALNPEPPESAAQTLAGTSPFWFWQIIILLSAWLHLHYHLPHAACNLMLRVLRMLFVVFGALKRDDYVPVTLKTNLKRLGLVDQFRVRPTCPQCRRMYPSDSAADLMCSACNTPLFGSADDSSQPSRTLPESKRKPLLVTPTRLISDQLAGFLNQPGMEDEIDAWRTRPHTRGKLDSIQDGRIWSTIPGHDGRPFFENGEDRPDPDELRIGITMNYDGYVSHSSFNCFSDKRSPCLGFPLSGPSILAHIALV